MATPLEHTKREPVSHYRIGSLLGRDDEEGEIINMKGTSMAKTNGHNEINRNLRCILTDDETRSYGQELARANASKDEAEERKKEVDAQLKAEIESHSTRALNLARKINNGYEYRDVKCALEFDYKKNMVTVRRSDTGDVIETRVMTVDERQVSLALETE